MAQETSVDVTGNSLLEPHSMSTHSTKSHSDFRGTEADTRRWQTCGDAARALLDAVLGEITASSQIAC